VLQNSQTVTCQCIAIDPGVNAVAYGTLIGTSAIRINYSDHLDNPNSQDWFSWYQRWRDYEWIEAASNFLEEYKQASYRVWTEIPNLFAQICGRVERAALMLGRTIERFFHARLIEHRVLQTLVGN
jgi:hypothetical protein